MADNIIRPVIRICMMNADSEEVGCSSNEWRSLFHAGPISTVLSWGVLGKSWSMLCGDAFGLCASSVRNRAEAPIPNRDSGIRSDIVGCLDPPVGNSLLSLRVWSNPWSARDNPCPSKRQNFDHRHSSNGSYHLETRASLLSHNQNVEINR